MMVFAPHSDDETLGCGGTIAKKISEGYEVIIVVMTDGKYALLKTSGTKSNPTPEELKKTRKEEVKRATEILGVPNKNVLFLDFEDGELGERKKEVEKEVIELFREHSPVEVYFPYGKDVHADHQAASLIIRSCIQKLGLSVRGYQYSIFQKSVRVGPIRDRFLNIFRHNLIYVDISQFVQQKKAALKEFRSQMTIISDKQETPVIENWLVDRFLKNKEIFYSDDGTRGRR
jgi:LmbE family N-acetylglucosaminyl deacetylase